MTDLNDFRAALRAPDPEQRPLDIGQIMTKGARVRRRRRFSVGATSGLAVIALLVGGNQIAQLNMPTTDPPPGIELGAPSPGTSAGTGARTEPEIAGQLGEVIPTGMTTTDGGEWVFYATSIDGDRPDVTFGIMLGQRTADGKLTDGVMANETDGADRTPGFHAVSGSMNVDYRDTPMFGYYVGPVLKITGATITGKVDGRTVTARQAPWSEDPTVIVFWFDLDTVTPSSDLTDLAAHDKDGNELPAGNTTIGVG